MAHHERIDPSGTALIAYDVCRRALAPADPARRAAMRPVLDAWVRLIASARSAGVPVIYTTPVSRADGADVARAIESDPMVTRLGDAIDAALFAVGPPPVSVFTLSSFQWRLRERYPDRLRYATRTLTTARVAHFRSLDLPAPLSFLYPILRLGHDFIALPVWQALRPRRP